MPRVFKQNACGVVYFLKVLNLVSVRVNKAYYCKMFSNFRGFKFLKKKKVKVGKINYIQYIGV